MNDIRETLHFFGKEIDLILGDSNVDRQRHLFDLYRTAAEDGRREAFVNALIFKALLLDARLKPKSPGAA